MVKKLLSIFILLPLCAHPVVGTTLLPDSEIKFPQATTTNFTKEEKENLVRYWNAPGRYTITAADHNNILQTRLTPEGSLWLWKYRKARGLTGPPTKTHTPENEQVKLWDNWIDSKIEYDRYHSLQTVQHLSKIKTTFVDNDTPLFSPHPGPMPESLHKLVGNAPNFIKVVTPLTYTIKYENNQTYQYRDHIDFKHKKFAYYRFHQGVLNKGNHLKNISKNELDELFSAAKISAKEQNVLRAVSLLEGGFDTINTYDTGYVTCGFIQFTTERNGTGTLCRLLSSYKLSNPENFQKDFRNFGIDVDSKNQLIVIDPSTGAELAGPDAVMKTIEDKRLISVFERAGIYSKPYKIAQLLACINSYLPTNVRISIKHNGKTHKPPISKFIQSEAGLATIMDRKVNTGNHNLLQSACQAVMKKYNLTKCKLLKNHEREIIQSIKYRKNFLTDKKLSQPAK